MPNDATLALNHARQRMESALATKSALLESEIRRMLTDQPFKLDRGVKKTAVDAIHFEYEFDSFLPMACPLNTTSGYCGAGQQLLLLARGEKQLFPKAIRRDFVEALPKKEQDQGEDRLSELETALYVAWFRQAWQQARSAAPQMLGFLSVHDTLWRTDLDSGETFREDSGRVKFF